ncbi:hypothetical protein [Pseudoalteromonas piscicida]|uniref:hypothetical protein n=1 Tax=Pseudoalteromonas piscicida TaxID=43662 RepID=UPI000E35D67A|nr:hypothetical protein [Pseudoalteromonas piscicida]AXQ97563.1 hypothetical protein D0N37_07225 [Pseudoalteromonas piscicida]
MIEQTNLVINLLLDDKDTLTNEEIINLSKAHKAHEWFATDRATATEWGNSGKPAIVSYYGAWIGI